MANPLPKLVKGFLMHAITPHLENQVIHINILASELVKKGVLVGEDVGVVDAGQDSDFIEAVGDLFLGEVHDAHLLHGVFLIVLLALDPVHGGEGAFAQLSHHGVLVHAMNHNN